MRVRFGGAAVLQSCFAQALLSVPSLPGQQRIAEADERLRRRAGLGGAQRFEAANRRQDRDRLPLAKPRRRLIRLEARQRLIGLCGDEHLEGQLGQRARRHDEQPLALDEVFDPAEQIAIKRMRGGGIEGRDLLRPSASVPSRALQTSRLSSAIPPVATIEPAAQRRHALPQGAGAQADACPASLLFCERENNRLFGNLADLPEIEKQHQGIPFAEQRLRVRERKRLRIGQFRVIGEGLAQRGLLLRKLGLDLRDGGARRFRGLGIGLARRRIEAAIGRLARAQQILLFAHELAKLLAALGKPRGHGGKRIRRIVLQRPLRRLEALGAVCSIACPGAVKRPRIGPKLACILRKNRLPSPPRSGSLPP